MGDRGGGNDALPLKVSITRAAPREDRNLEDRAFASAASVSGAKPEDGGLPERQTTLGNGSRPRNKKIRKVRPANRIAASPQRGAD